MRERLFYCDPLLWIECLQKGKKIQRLGTIVPAKSRHEVTHQGLSEEIDRVWIRVGEELRKGLLLPERQGTDVVPRAARRDRVELVEGRRAEYVEDESELVMIVPPREERFA